MRFNASSLMKTETQDMRGTVVDFSACVSASRPGAVFYDVSEGCAAYSGGSDLTACVTALAFGRARAGSLKTFRQSLSFCKIYEQGISQILQE